MCLYQRMFYGSKFAWDYHFLFIGSGAEKENLVKKVSNEKIGNVTMLDSVPKKEIVDYLSILDISLINLKKDDLFKTVIPSKIFENAAMEIPIMIGVDGESRGIVESFGAGVYYEPENKKDFISKLNEMDIAKSKSKFGTGGRKLAQFYDRTRLAKDMFDVLRDC